MDRYTEIRSFVLVAEKGSFAAAAVVEPTNESDRVRLLRDRLDTEERRVLELEEELTNLRRRQLGLAPRGR